MGLEPRQCPQCRRPARGEGTIQTDGTFSLGAQYAICAPRVEIGRAGPFSVIRTTSSVSEFHKRSESMKMRTMALSFMMIACFSGIAFAGMTWSPPVNVGSIEVSDVSAGGTGPAGVYLTFSATPFPSAFSACSAGWTGQWAVVGNTDNVKNIMAIATP